MHVYVITQAHDHEGEQPIAVFASLDKAKAFGAEHAASRGYEPTQWIDRDGPSEPWWEMELGCSQIIIRCKQVLE